VYHPGRSRRRLALARDRSYCALVAGWAAFNLVEGLIDHETLGIHHVRDDLVDQSAGTSASSASAPYCSSSA